MTWEQWLFEYIALRRREHAEFERSVETQLESLKALRAMLINILGLNVFGEKTPAERREDEKAGLDPETPRFMPLAYMIGDPDWVRHLQEFAQRRTGENAANEDEAFDRLSQSILDQIKGKPSDLPADMTPILLGDLKDLERNSYWQSFEAHEALARMGVKTRSPGSAPAPHVEKTAQPFKTMPDFEDTKPTVMDPAELAKFRAALADDDQ